jgi:catalase
LGPDRTSATTRRCVVRRQPRSRRRSISNEGRAKNYEPNSFGGPIQTNEPLYAYKELSGRTGPHDNVRHSEDDDFVQAGMLYRVMTPPERDRLVDNIAGGLAQVSRNDIVERSMEHFRRADAEYGERIAKRVAEITSEG